MASQEIVAQAEKKDLSFADLRKMLGEKTHTTKFIQYDALSQFRDIAELFGSDNSVIILMSIKGPNAPAAGHFIALLNKPNFIEHFDSYGFSIDQELNITHEQDLLGNMLRSSGKSIVQSKRKYQKMREYVNTCGRWCVVRVRHYNMSRSEFSSFIDSTHQEPDVAVTMLTMSS